MGTGLFTHSFSFLYVGNSQLPVSGQGEALASLSTMKSPTVALGILRGSVSNDRLSQGDILEAGNTLKDNGGIWTC